MSESNGQVRQSSSSDDDVQEEYTPMLPKLQSSKAAFAREQQEDGQIESDEEAQDWDETGPLAARNDVESPARTERRSYGGRQKAALLGEDQQGDATVIQVAVDLAASCLAGTPLLMPYAFQLTGLALGLPSLFLIAFLSWVAHVVLAVEARYVGKRSLGALASAVFPQKVGSFVAVLVDVWQVFAAGLKVVVTLSLCSQMLSDIAQAILPRFPLTHKFSFTTILLSLAYGTPSLSATLVKTFSRSSFQRVKTWLNIVLLLAALIIIGVRMDAATEPSGRTIAHQGLMGNSVWAGASIMTFILAGHDLSFTFQSSLRQTSSSSIRNHLIIQNPIKRVKAHGWETASFFSLLIAALVSMGYGLVGYLLSFASEPLTINVFANLPIHDGWLVLARFLVLSATLLILPTIVRPPKRALARILLLPLQLISPATYGSNSTLRGAPEDSDTSDDPAAINGSDTGSRQARTGRLWLRQASIVTIWLLVTTVTVLCLRKDESRLASVAEVGGFLAANCLGFLSPALFFIILFHIRKARSIFVANPRAMDHDELLLRKERQLQRRLSGRRLSQDLVVFALLLPFSLALLIRGALAIVHRSTIQA